MPLQALSGNVKRGDSHTCFPSQKQVDCPQFSPVKHDVGQDSRMRKVFLAFVFGLVLLWPPSASAHELNPAYYPLGPLPVLLASEMWLIILMLPIVLVVETFILAAWARELGVKANLWRVAVLYVVARGAETAADFSLLAIGPSFGWFAPGWTSSATETFGSLLLCLVAGLIAKLLVALLLYRRTRLATARIAGAVGLATLSGYLSALVWSFIVRAILF